MRPLNTTPKSSFSPTDEAQFLRAAREYALHRYPNRDRKGCPKAHEIAAIARREVPLGEVVDRAGHIATCSPCLAEYLSIQEAWNRRRRFKIVGLTAAAAMLLLGFLSAISFKSSVTTKTIAPPQESDDSQRAAPTEMAILDLRPLEVTRGKRSEPLPVPVIGRANLRLKILLPVGSGEGSYEFQVRDANDAPQIRGAGSASILDYVTTIDTTADLRSLKPGTFTWAIRRVDETAWHFYRIEVR